MVEKNRKILSGIVETIILCGKQNIALRGHEDDFGNFRVLLHYQAKYNQVLFEHLNTCNPRTKYTSPQIQNELISICGKIITDDLVAECNDAGVFGFMADEATDAATMEQMSLCVRFVDKTTSTVREEFLGFSSTTSTTGEVLANAFIDILTKLGVRTENMRGQGYYGASNMSGIHRGVQAKIRQLIPETVYTHCKAHCLNLAIIHASKERYSKNMMDTVQQVAFAFSYSAKRLLLFQETLADDNIVAS
ncbi:52 kDa repressor of the inhibitor of the protein kinase-like [Dreissena polymorpha]|uniref:52 kDa repressor of the inhibitor of the protein kinase-like n=1 Tax=Dreissena polymorpha TaxID=45954 RepID=UPI0022646138|nr:52 kDa repressor of the inhibitor of the protein kinase-like [Dreissena polymorpha]